MKSHGGVVVSGAGAKVGWECAVKKAETKLHYPRVDATWVED
jgi:hypothetical protein